MRRRLQGEDLLTPRELEVLGLLRQGLTNEQIADQLGISFGTAKYHVGEILSKLGVHSRREALQLTERRKPVWQMLPLWSWFESVRLPVLLAAALTVAAAIGIVMVSQTWGHRGSNNPISYIDSPVGLDIAPKDQLSSGEGAPTLSFPHTVLVSKSMPTSIGNEGAIISSLPTVSSVAELHAALTPAIKVIVIDKSAIGDLLGADILRGQLEQGRAIVGLNVSLADLHRVIDRDRNPNLARWETSPDGTTTYKTANEVPSLDDLYPAPPLGVSFFSIISAAGEEEAEALLSERTDPTKPVELSNDIQIIFASDTFTPALQLLDAGGWNVSGQVIPAPSYCERRQEDGSWSTSVDCP